MKQFLITALSCGVLLGTAFVNSRASTPSLVNYQGVLTNNSGDPQVGTFDVTISIYDVAMAGTALWTETQSVTTDVQGRFNVLLGSMTALTDAVFSGPDRWLGTAVEADAEMMPRTRIATVAYAFRPATVDGASGGTITSKVTIGLGQTNTGEDSFVAGSGCEVTSDYSVVSGGRENICAALESTVGGGRDNIASGQNATVAGGILNWASGNGATVAGGVANHASGYAAMIAGGSWDTASGAYAFIGAGLNNDASGNWDCIGGGENNDASGDHCTIAGGYANSATGFATGVASGYVNATSGYGSCIAGGIGNVASGDYSAVGGGEDNTAGGHSSFVCGSKVNSGADSAFTFGDGTESFNTQADQTASFLTTGGFRIWTANPVSSNIGARLPAGSGTWGSLCDSTMKRNKRPVDTEDILEKVNQLPIKQWSYISQDPGIEHIGPTAQDFWNLFHIGDDSLTISTIDPSGIALAAIQELARQNAVMAGKIARLESIISQRQPVGTVSKFEN